MEKAPRRNHLKKIIIAITIALALSTISYAEQFPTTGTIDVYFSPRGGATESIVGEINNAQSEILVQAYSFTSTPIVKALVGAKKRGIRGPAPFVALRG